ncbi:ornithine carbamoyltransferase [Saccharothrix coeruleofusca]|uniref:Ornithine carbamoyltransferase n=1 Tax=Saccharothrix coeruleofusca TaxID=33919 RepID=A0A918ASI4_9PSEU|nr:ornithine carbamoyltransferase [Saccharothrix coeruleofusca]MBP2336773.1 ornithine carbamoyltransferase [Saccharothrix coeruleofusca]GGP78138.1 ornithine carbamoyltransferase [Saccharothrix coeruleofusca]
MGKHMGRHLISIGDLADHDLRHIVGQGVRFAEGSADPRGLLDGAVVGVYFRKTSTRTRTAFSSGALRLGARLITYGPDDLQLNTGETVADTGRVLGRMLDVLVARTAGAEQELREFAQPGGMGVVNAMSALEHPTQALADLTTLTQRFGAVDGLRVLYVGEGNNTCTALALALSRFSGVHFEARTPPGYGMPESITAAARAQAARTGSTVVERHDVADLPPDCHVIYTTRWQTTGTSKPDPHWRQAFEPYRVHRGLWRDSPDAVFMHDLPAHRGEEVTAEVLDGPRSIAFDQAANKMTSAMAVLRWCAAGAASELAGVTG